MNLSAAIKRLYESKSSLWFIFCGVAFFYLWDIGNVDGLRQGTEGFYLLISKEMFQSKSFITPLYMGDYHWSKPPLHFWMAMPFYSLGMPFLMAARLSMVILTLCSLLYFAHWNQKHFSVSAKQTFLYLASSFAFLKYGKIYMMEAPLTFISGISLLLYWDYLYSKEKKHLILSSIFLGLSILIKGPVSFVMVTGAIGLYYLSSRQLFRKESIRDIIILVLVSISVGSSWFFAIYAKHGMEAIEFFFIRENLGKFTAKSYPFSSVLQGLLLYSLPWTLLIPGMIPFGKKINQWLKRQESKDAFLYLAIGFCVFFLIWFLPKQKSHHYALPSIPYFLLIIQNICTLFLQNERAKVKNIMAYISFALFTLIVLIFSISFVFPEFSSNTLSIILYSAVLITIMVSNILMLKMNNYYYKVLYAFIITASIWNFLLPAFYLPLVPSKIVDQLEGKQVAVVYRRPYYIEERLNREVEKLGPLDIRPHMAMKTHYYIVREEIYNKHNLDDVATVVSKWSVWQRGNKFRKIIEAIRSRNLSILKENILLLKSH